MLSETKTESTRTARLRKRKIGKKSVPTTSARVVRRRLVNKEDFDSSGVPYLWICVLGSFLLIPLICILVWMVPRSKRTVAIEEPVDYSDPWLALKRLQKDYKIDGIRYKSYAASGQRYRAVFARDTLYSALILKDKEMLRGILDIACALQADQIDTQSGAEPGKIFHEYPPMIRRKRSTLYSASDTTGLFIIGFDEYCGVIFDPFCKEHWRSVIRALEYTLNHIKDGIFFEDPALSGAPRFVLKVTYWKDSTLHDRKSGAPVYPVSYSLLQALNLKALRSGAELLKIFTNIPDLLSDRDRKLVENLAIRVEAEIKPVLRGLFTFVDQDRSTFLIGHDAEILFTGVSSDTVHLLWFLEPRDFDGKPKFLSNLADSAIEALGTQYGFRGLDVTSAMMKRTQYHGLSIWPFEQALIHQAAVKFNLPNVGNVAKRIHSFLKSANSFPELIECTKKEPDMCKAGDEKTQLWTVASYLYFSWKIGID